MDGKPWLWRKKSAEKNAASDESSKESEDKVQALLAEKGELENDLVALNERLSAALAECGTKDELVKMHAEIAQEYFKGQEKAEEEAVSLKAQLHEATQHEIISEERLKECTRKQREFEKSKMVLEEKLVDTSKRLARTVNENAHLGKTLQLREKLIDELNRQLNQVEADFGTLMARLEATEKDNCSFKYEIRVLEKELEIRNEEREFNRRTSEASHRQHLESMKKIAKLESECQRLRILVQKRLPGPAALNRMKNEVEFLGRGSVDSRRMSTPTGFMPDSPRNFGSETPSRRISSLTDQLYAMEEENRDLREVLVNKTNILSQFESSRELSLASVSVMGSDDKASCDESWASVLISEPENQKGTRPKSGVRDSDMSLMDDFVEMEKLAVVSGSSSSEAFGYEIVPVSDTESMLSTTNQEIKFTVDGKIPVWIEDTLKLISDQKRKSEKSFQEILENIRRALNFNASEKNKSICKMIELIEGLGLQSPDYETLEKNSGKKNSDSDGYSARVLQWKTSEISGVLQKFVHACYDLLNGKGDFEKFVQELTSALEWIINHCFSLQDVSTMRDAIIKECDWDDSRSESDFPTTVSVSNGYNVLLEGVKSTMVEQRRKSKDELAGKLLLEASDTKEQLMKQLVESERVIESLQTKLKELRKNYEDQIEHQKTVNEDLDEQLTVIGGELIETRQQFSSLEVELENKNSCFEELQATCVELQLQLESMKQESPEVDFGQEEKLRTDREITAASEKLAECQETIIHIGKQLKALSTPKVAARFDDAVKNRDLKPTTETRTKSSLKNDKIMNLRTSLLDRMQAEDKAVAKRLKSPETKEIDRNSTAKTTPFGPIETLEKILVLEPMAIVPTTKNGGGSLWRKLWRKKKAKSLKTQVSLSSLT